MVNTDVKSTRPYRSVQRSADAAATRRRVLSAAAELFADHGYGMTTMQQIAERAGVSVETVHLNGRKRALLAAAFEQTWAGDDRGVPLMSRDDLVAFGAISDTTQALAAYVDFVVQANARGTRLWCAFRSAADVDPRIGDDFRSVLERRHAEFPRILALLEGRGLLGDAASAQALGDALEFVLSPESYEQLVIRAGWNVHQYRVWLLGEVTSLLERAAGARLN